MKTPKYTPLKWEAEYDDNDNTTWVADSCAHDEGSPFQCRIYPVLRADKIIWLDGSDEEIGQYDEPWASAEEAKESLEGNNRLMWEEAMKDGSFASLGEEDEE